VSHANARLNMHGRLLLIDRVLNQGWAVAHAARAIGISRQCAHRWVNRYRQHGPDALVDTPPGRAECPTAHQPIWRTRSLLCAALGGGGRVGSVRSWALRHERFTGSCAVTVCRDWRCWTR